MINRIIRQLQRWGIISRPEPTTTPAPTTTTTTPAPCTVRPTPTLSVTHNFVWKVISESDKNLVILISQGYRQHVQALRIIWRNKSDGSYIVKEIGRFAGDTHNGCRPHFRFSQPGTAYIPPEGFETVVQWFLRDGSRANADDLGFRELVIQNPGQDLRT